MMAVVFSSFHKADMQRIELAKQENTGCQVHLSISLGQEFYSTTPLL
jgi:hypothetical protein